MFYTCIIYQDKKSTFSGSSMHESVNDHHNREDIICLFLSAKLILAWHQKNKHNCRRQIVWIPQASYWWFLSRDWSAKAKLKAQSSQNNGRLKKEKSIVEYWHPRPLCILYIPVRIRCSSLYWEKHAAMAQQPLSTCHVKLLRRHSACSQLERWGCRFHMESLFNFLFQSSIPLLQLWWNECVLYAFYIDSFFALFFWRTVSPAFFLLRAKCHLKIVKQKGVTNMNLQFYELQVSSKTEIHFCNHMENTSAGHDIWGSHGIKYNTWKVTLDFQSFSFLCF